MKSTDIDIEQAVAKVNNKFDLILIAATRARELERGKTKLLATKTKPPITALLEIQHGLVGMEILKTVSNRRPRSR